MAFIYIVPKHIWEGVDDPIIFSFSKATGSGPFRLAEASQGEFIQLETNADYWGTPPNVDGVIFQTIDNADARVTALTTGDIDAITEFPATAVSTLQNTEGITVHIADIAAGGSLRDIMFNVTADEDWFEVYEDAGYSLQINLDNLPADYDLELYDAAGTKVASSLNASTTAEAITYLTPAAGYYTVRVFGYNGATSSATAYQLTVVVP